MATEAAKANERVTVQSVLPPDLAEQLRAQAEFERSLQVATFSIE